MALETNILAALRFLEGSSGPLGRTQYVQWPKVTLRKPFTMDSQDITMDSEEHHMDEDDATFIDYVDVPCVANSLSEGNRLDIGGRWRTVEFKLFVRHSLFFTAASEDITAADERRTADEDLQPPREGLIVKFRDLFYRISTCSLAGPQTHYELFLADPHSNQ